MSKNLTGEFLLSVIRIFRVIHPLHSLLTVIQMLHCLKYYYWLVDPRARSGYVPKGLGISILHCIRNFTVDGARPDNSDIVTIRTNILQFVKRLILRPPEVDTFSKDDELQALFNYMATVIEVGAHE